MFFSAHLMPCLTEDLGLKTYEQALVALPMLRIKFISFILGFLPALRTRENAAKFSADLTAFLFFFFFSFSFQLDKNAASSSSVAGVAAVKSKQPTVKTSQIPAAEAERERFRAN